MCWYSRIEGKCTRVDFAIDVKGSGMKFNDLKSMVETGHIKTKVPRDKITYQSNFNDRGWTIYVGKKS